MPSDHSKNASDGSFCRANLDHLLWLTGIDALGHHRESDWSLSWLTEPLTAQGSVEASKNEVRGGVQSYDDALERRPTLVVGVGVQDNEWEPTPRQGSQGGIVQTSRTCRDQRNVNRASLDRIVQLYRRKAMMVEGKTRPLQLR